MTSAEYLKFHADFCADMTRITAMKNKDYTAGSGDPFYNFTRVEAVGFCTTEQGFLTRMFDKFSRLATFVHTGVVNVKDESIYDTLVDLANYSALFAGFIAAKKEGGTKK